ncbi:hypothetical protein JOQ06_014667 [Pogonophryne albipinna]|uniref:Uncharacterized protein n=1 Tax=Pogonophryne albipinna TaxID=1090488 RepID=A0AAD6FAN4_9TELE|nr:hypothetical protein JOQ06_014667 [Pogonophryne albipinna]
MMSSAQSPVSCETCCRSVYIGAVRPLFSGPSDRYSPGRQTVIHRAVRPLFSGPSDRYSPGRQTVIHRAVRPLFSGPFRSAPSSQTPHTEFYWLSDFLSGSMISSEGTVAAGEARFHRLYAWFDPESAAVVTILLGLFQVLLSVPLAYADQTLPKLFILPLVLGILVCISSF